MRPPGYRYSNDGPRRCATCGAYQAGWCRMYSTVVFPFMVCPRWFAA